MGIITGIIIGVVSGYIGSLMLSKRMSLVAGPLGHLALPGIALALIYNFDITLGAFPFVILGGILIWLFEIKTKLPLETLTAIVFALGVSISFLFLPIEKAEKALIGDILSIDIKAALLTVIISIFIILVISKIYKKIILSNISEDLAKVEWKNFKKYQFLYLFCIALVISIGVRICGGLLTAALTAIPSATARNISKNLKQYIFFSSFLGGFSVFLGTLISIIFHLPPGPAIIIISTIFFLISILLKPSK